MLVPAPKYWVESEADIKNIRLRPYKDSDWEHVRDFIRTNWREDHPVCKKTLFDWQFGGFGNDNKKISSLLLLHDDEVIGMRGIIPGLYQVPVEKKKMRVVQGGSLAMWMIRKDFRGPLLGPMMHLEVQKMMSVITGAGSDPKTSLPIYLANGFSVLNSMNRYVAPLDAQGYLQLLSQKMDIGPIREWAKVLGRCEQSIEPHQPDLDIIARLWEETTFPMRIFSLYRNAEFWKWRYLDSKGFRYHFFGDARDAGLMVARIEIILSNKMKELNGQKVFRILEILPRNSQVWKGEVDTRLIELLQGSIKWALDQGCLAADFYCSTSRLEPILKSVGFRKQDIRSGTRICSLAPLFEPLEYPADPINALFRVEVPGKGLMNIDFDNTYMVKSENDMDRPNICNFQEIVSSASNTA